MNIIPFEQKYYSQLITLIAQNRIELAELKNRIKKFDLNAAKEELDYYFTKQYPIFIAINDNLELIGFTVCRVDEDVVWDELLYIIPEERRKGVGSALFKKAEQLALSKGGQTLYNWVHPNNFRSIPFLKKHGYDVLNLIEIRKKLSGEETTEKIRIGDFSYNY
jgi:GNAT superfamily N-acetyltransferase